MLAQKEQQIELALDLDLALHLIDLDDEAAAGRLNEVVCVDRAFANCPNTQHFWQAVFDRKAVAVLLRNWGVCSHDWVRA